MVVMAEVHGSGDGRNLIYQPHQINFPYQQPRQIKTPRHLPHQIFVTRIGQKLDFGPK